MNDHLALLLSNCLNSLSLGIAGYCLIKLCHEVTIIKKDIINLTNAINKLMRIINDEK